MSYLVRSGDPVTLHVLDTYVRPAPAVIFITGNTQVLPSARGCAGDFAALRVAGTVKGQLIRVALVEMRGYTLAALVIAATRGNTRETSSTE